VSGCGFLTEATTIERRQFLLMLKHGFLAENIMNKAFNLNMMKVAGRKKIKDRGINWKESYEDKSESLKKKFDSAIGPNAYIRWEGHDYTTNSDYYVVVGPTIQNELGKCFFSGIKKLPADPDKKVYSPSGEYFTDIVAAFSYASDKWGVPFPKNVPHYNKSMLEGVSIPEHIRG